MPLAVQLHTALAVQLHTGQVVVVHIAPEGVLHMDFVAEMPLAQQAWVNHTYRRILLHRPPGFDSEDKSSF